MPSSPIGATVRNAGRHHLSRLAQLTLRRGGSRRAAARSYLFDLLARTTPSLAVVDGDIQYYVSTDDWLGRATFSSGQFSADVLAHAVQLIRTHRASDPLAGKIFLDAGANIGTSTIPALQRFEAAHAISIEPDPANHRLLRCNLLANDLFERTTTLQLALSNINGTAVLERSTSNTGDHRVRLSGVANGAFDEATRPTLEVPVRRLDDLLTELHISHSNLGMVWMDIQGHEALALEGAPDLLNSNVPLVIEYWPYGLRRTNSLDNLTQLLIRHYPVIIDLRASMTSQTCIRVAHQDLAGLPKRYAKRATSHTDLLLLTV